MPTLIRNGIVLPMAAAGPARRPGVRGRREGHAVIPGLHNWHMHSGLLRGTAESFDVARVRADAPAGAEELFERRARLTRSRG